ncbi:MAG TPA: hypothetical protein VK837_01045 [Longimicrobiales bacterium]|nr:hypothetical protein [Longimicrobiales bacterium]
MARPCTAVPTILAWITLALAVPASAQEARVSERLRHKDRLAEIRLPAAVAAAEFVVGASRARAARGAAPAAVRARADDDGPPPSLPGPVPSQTKVIVMGALGGGPGSGPADVQNPGPPVLDRIELSARRPWVNEKGYVDFLLPYDVDTSVPVVNFNKNFPGSLEVHLKLEEGRSYLVDFALSSWGAGTYRAEVDGSAQEFADPQGDLEHVLVALQATEDGWARISFRREGTGYYLYTVTAERVN